MPSRRTFMTGAAALAGAGALASAGWCLAQRERRRLAIPELLDARRLAQGIALEVRAGRTEFFPGRESLTLGYNGAYLGPTIRVHRGDEVEVAVANALSAGTTVHWHGLLVPGPLDGGPHQWIAPGRTWRPVLPIDQPAATLFYHSHVHGATAEQVWLGLAGVLIVADDEEAALGLPREYGVDDLPIVIQDRVFSAGRLVLPGGMMTAMAGRRGDVMLANGTPDAVAPVPAAPVRLRLVNGSNARFYELRFDDGRRFDWIASEGGLLAAPVAMDHLVLSPGERAEIVVDFSDGRTATLVTGPDRNLPRMMGGMGGMGMMGGGFDDFARRDVVAFEPHGERRAAAPLPARLASPALPDPARAVRRRTFTLDMGMMGGGMGMGGRGRRRGMGMMGGFAINGRPFEMRRIDERVRVGDTEIWQVRAEAMSHPFHVHGVHFAVLSRDGRPAPAFDQGLRDTVRVEGTVELAVRFGQPAERSPFMYHCHILEHEDAGMMGQYDAA